VNKIYAEHTGILAGRDWTRGYLGVKNHLPTTDPLLLIKSGGDLKLYEQVAQDDQVKSCLQQRFRALISHDWRVVPASEKRSDIQKADFVTQQLKALRWDEIVEKMLWGVFYGYSISEVLWEKQGERVGIAAIKVRNRRRFHFGEDQKPRLITYKDPMGEELPEQKFWHFCCGADHDDEPYGRGLAFWLYWYVIKFKKPTIAHKARHSELFAMPARKATYPNNATQQEKDTVWEALSAFGVDSQIMLPEGFLIELIEASRAGDGGYDTMIEICNKAIAKVILSQSLTTDSAATGLGSNQADVAQDVARSIVEADADLICASFNSSVVRWLIDFNWPGTTEYPRFEYDLATAPDLKSLADRDRTLADMGFPPTPEYITKTYGEGFQQPEKEVDVAPLSTAQVSALTSLISIGSGWPPKALEAAINIAFPLIPIEQVQALTTALSPAAEPTNNGEAPAPGDSGSTPEDLSTLFEAPAPNAPIASVAAQLEELDLFKPWLEQLQKGLEESTTLEEFQELLHGSFEDLDPADFRQAMAQATILAGLTGYENAKEGN
jgi:phage gp29-like protein